LITLAERQHRQVSLHARMYCSNRQGVLKPRHCLTREQAPGADEPHKLVPKGKVGSIPTPATKFFVARKCTWCLSEQPYKRHLMGVALRRMHLGGWSGQPVATVNR